MTCTIHVNKDHTESVHWRCLVDHVASSSRYNNNNMFPALQVNTWHLTSSLDSWGWSTPTKPGPVPFIWLSSWPVIKNKNFSVIIIYPNCVTPLGGSLSLTAFIKQVFSAWNSLAHRSFCSSCLLVVVAATHFPYTAAWDEEKHMKKKKSSLATIL